MYTVTSFNAVSGAYQGTLTLRDYASASATFATLASAGRTVRMHRVDGLRSVQLASNAPPRGC